MEDNKEFSWDHFGLKGEVSFRWKQSADVHICSGIQL